MSRSSGWTDDIFNPHFDPNARHKNKAIASSRLSKVTLARWVVFKTFIQVAKELEGDVPQDNIKRDWLLFQILPLVRISDMDPFSALISLVLGGVHSRVLESLIAPFGPSSVLGSSFNSTTDSFFYVIDEAQVASERYLGAFADETGAKKRPVLSPIIQHMTESTRVGIKVIISGTGFSLELCKELMASGVGKDSSGFDVVHYRRLFRAGYSIPLHLSLSTSIFPRL